MASYLVTWEVDIFDAASPREAAQRAFDMVRGADTTATVFKVIEHDGNGEQHSVDLLEGAKESKSYPHLPERCPTKHFNDGTDICADCGEYLG